MGFRTRQKANDTVRNTIGGSFLPTEHFHEGMPCRGQSELYDTLRPEIANFDPEFRIEPLRDPMRRRNKEQMWG